MKTIVVSQIEWFEVEYDDNYIISDILQYIEIKDKTYKDSKFKKLSAKKRKRLVVSEYIDKHRLTRKNYVPEAHVSRKNPNEIIFEFTGGVRVFKEISGTIIKN